MDLIDNFDNEYSLVGNEGSTLYFKTNYKAALHRVVSIKLENPEPANWVEIIPETKEALQGASLLENNLLQVI